MPSRSLHREILTQMIVPASRSQVWEAWTTEGGAHTFFAPGCKIDLRPGGAYEMYFDLTAQPGSRGGEGAIILAIQPEQMLSITWNAPPSLPTARLQKTHVVIRLNEVSPTRTRVTLRHDGWGDGGEWDEAFDYFSRAWQQVALPRLRYSFEVEPVDWDNPYSERE